MTCEEFEAEVNRLLGLHGGSYARPSGWLPDNGLAFSCVSPPVLIPNPLTLSAEQRLLIARKLAERLER